MTTLAGNMRYHSAQILKVKHDAMMQLEQGISNKEVAIIFNIPANTLSKWQKKDNIVNAFKSSGRTKRQRIKQGTYEYIN